MSQVGGRCRWECPVVWLLTVMFFCSSHLKNDTRLITLELNSFAPINHLPPINFLAQKRTNPHLDPSLVFLSHSLPQFQLLHLPTSCFLILSLPPSHLAKSNLSFCKASLQCTLTTSCDMTNQLCFDVVQPSFRSKAILNIHKCDDFLLIT